MKQINIQFTLFSAFYTPLIVTMSGGFLKKHGLQPDWSIAAPGTSAIEALKDGSADVIQSAPSQGFKTAHSSEKPVIRHFAQVNEMDGFFLSARNPASTDDNEQSRNDFDWKQLEGADVVLFASGQPNIMFRYACQRAGIDYDKINVITPGGAAAIDKAFRDGQGQYVQQQGPYPQQLEHDGVASIVAKCGPLIGPNAFSSLAATTEWLQSDTAKAFTQAYAEARNYLVQSPAGEIAKQVDPYFKEAGQQVDLEVLEQCIASYQSLGCWTPHTEITADAFKATINIFSATGNIDQDYAYDTVCSSPPD